MTVIGALLAFYLNGTLRGTFIDDDRIADQRGLAVDPEEKLVFLNSGADRVLAISSHGRVVRDTGRIEGLNPGGGIFGPDGISVSAAAALELGSGALGRFWARSEPIWTGTIPVSPEYYFTASAILA